MCVQATAWATWRQHVQLRKIKRAALLPVMQSLQLQKCKRLLTAWRAASKRLAALQATEAACAARLRVLALATAVSGWKGWAARKQHQR